MQEYVEEKLGPEAKDQLKAEVRAWLAANELVSETEGTARFTVNEEQEIWMPEAWVKSEVVGQEGQALSLEWNIVTVFGVTPGDIVWQLGDSHIDVEASEIEAGVRVDMSVYDED